MNIALIFYIIGRVLQIEAVFLLPSCAVALSYGEWQGWVYLGVAAAAALAGQLICMRKPKNMTFLTRDGFAAVSLSWLVLSAVGALPLRLCGDIRSYTDALFETISGFTTTGASILTDVEALSYSSLFWRSLTHWIGGMGVLVFLLAIVPMHGGTHMQLMRAESPGPSVGKLVPRVRSTAKILYLIYLGLTATEVILLLCGGMPLFDSLTLSFGTAGTGGFAPKNTSVAGYSPYLQWVITIFMILFGVNFNLYYLILLGKGLEALKSEELHWYLGVVVFSAVSIALNLGRAYGDFFHNLRYSFFQVASIISTTGYGTADFNLWPTYSKWLLVLLMFFGACAGSTGGGLKFSRILILGKSIRLELRKQLRPHSVSIERLEGKPIGEATIHSTLVFFACYLFLFFLGTVIVSTDGLDLTTTFTSVVACLSNIGPGLELVGPMGSYIMFSPLSKIVLSLLMLLGRLEIFPILMLFSPRVWKK